MASDLYFGKYLTFKHPDKKEGAILLGADCLVGDRFEIEFKMEKGSSLAWLKNRFGDYVGCFDSASSRELHIISARGWTINALLSFVAYTDSPKPSHYWGQMAIIAFDPHFKDSFEVFTDKIARKLMEGIRPEIDLGKQATQEIINNKGNWTPKSSVSLPKIDTGMVIMKEKRNASEKIIEKARERNVGCCFISFAFLIACAAGLFYLLRAIGLF